MIFRECGLAGAFVIDLERREDERGFFARSWCREEFAAHGLTTRLAQCNVSLSRRRGTLRGMHDQVKPYEEAKLLRCIRGAVYDVMIDLRAESTTYLRWEGVELRADTYRMVYVPEGFAHGFQTLQDETEVFYLVSEAYRPDHERGVRWNDPTFGIRWPCSEPILSARDGQHPDFVPQGVLRVP
jgi:dTDP-4-dehydrorhamnose 3,5-epimerase